MHTAPGACSKNAPGAAVEQCAFKEYSWSVFGLEYSSRLLLVQDHIINGTGPYGPRAAGRGPAVLVILIVDSLDTSSTRVNIIY